MFFDFLLTLYIALPAFTANMAPVIATRLDVLPHLNKPLDGGYMLRDRRIFGENKTVRGLLIGVFCAGGVAITQSFTPALQNTLFTEPLTAIIYGVLAGCGALCGDAIASFIKRQINIASGKPFFPLDQIDYIVGFMLFTHPLMHWHLPEVISLLAFALIANPLTNATAYIFKIKKTYW